MGSLHGVQSTAILIENFGFIQSCIYDLHNEYTKYKECEKSGGNSDSNSNLWPKRFCCRQLWWVVGTHSYDVCSWQLSQDWAELEAQGEESRLRDEIVGYARGKGDGGRERYGKCYFQLRISDCLGVLWNDISAAFIKNKIFWSPAGKLNIATATNA